MENVDKFLTEFQRSLKETDEIEKEPGYYWVYFRNYSEPIVAIYRFMEKSREDEEDFALWDICGDDTGYNDDDIEIIKKIDPP